MARWLTSWQVTACAAALFLALGVFNLFTGPDGLQAVLWLGFGLFNGAFAVREWHDSRRRKKDRPSVQRTSDE